MNDGIYLLLGTNLGERSVNLSTAKHHISRRVGAIITESAIYRTSAWGKADQPEFYNQVIEISTSLTPQKTLEIILGIEHQMGRIRAEKWGTRIIDIDILLWQDSVIKNDTLTIPHPGIPKRRFTLVPLAEIIPAFLHPEFRKTIATLLDECADELLVEKVI